MEKRLAVTAIVASLSFIFCTIGGCAKARTAEKIEIGSRPLQADMQPIVKECLPKGCEAFRLADCIVDSKLHESSWADGSMTRGNAHANSQSLIRLSRQANHSTKNDFQSYRPQLHAAYTI